ncbi:MAG: hypothetical protein KF889_06185 [Alphaproteobacteria bacterium]|nr:hypothetical protein [Alphaproteobacteria bacterium]MCW5740406.1 hypothetical protein [Alphaproteobacteria bacterium]
MARGELVYAMDQDVPKFDESGMPPEWVAAGEGGRCVGFALRWVGLRAWGRDYHHTVISNGGVSGPTASGGFAEVPRDHALSRSITAGFLIRVETVLRQYEVPVNRARYIKASYGITAGFVMDRVFAGDGLYYFELRRNGGAHAIAVQRTGNIFRLFDANEGHFVLDGRKRFSEYIGEFLQRTSYASTYVAGTWVAGVTAIPPYPSYPPVPLLRQSTPDLRRDSHNGPWTHQWGKPAEVDLLGRRAVR